jgi:hypothetical protein
MNEVNFQSSVNNLVQMDRHQTDATRAPVVNQVQNSAIEQNEEEQKMQAPVQPEESEGKKVDVKQRKSDTHQRKRRQRSTVEKSPGTPGRTTTSGHFVDLQA